MALAVGKRVRPERGPNHFAVARFETRNVAISLARSLDFSPHGEQPFSNDIETRNVASPGSVRPSLLRPVFFLFLQFFFPQFFEANDFMARKWTHESIEMSIIRPRKYIHIFLFSINIESDVKRCATPDSVGNENRPWGITPYATNNNLFSRSNTSR